MIEILVGFLFLLVTILALRLRKLRKEYLKAIQLNIRAMDELVTALTNVIATVGEHNKVFNAQQQLNEVFAKHFEVLGIHTKLIKPSIGYEAEQFLAWYNKKREGKENG